MMFVVTRLFRILLKWLYTALIAGKQSKVNVDVAMNGRGRAASGSEDMADRAYSHLKQALEELEDSIDRKASQTGRGTATATASEVAEEIQDINELRAELAELKADIRALRRANSPLPTVDPFTVAPHIEPVGDDGHTHDDV